MAQDIDEARTQRYIEVQQSAEFALFLAWYFLYVVLATYAPSFMATKVLGNITIGLILGLLQFASTFAITMIYARWADRELDPAAAKLAEHMEGGSLS